MFQISNQPTSFNEDLRKHERQRSVRRLPFIFIYLVPRGARRMTGGTPNDAYMDMERMKRTVKGLQEQLALADDTIRKLKSKEKDLGDRYDFTLLRC